MSILIEPAERQWDKHGGGAYGAPRGRRKHMGVDLACYPGSILLAPQDGRVTKLGYPYAKHLEYRYVQLTVKGGYKLRFFYVLPSVRVGQDVKKGDPLGTVQTLGLIYPGITEHVHFEVMTEVGNFINPNHYIMLNED